MPTFQFLADEVRAFARVRLDAMRLDERGEGVISAAIAVLIMAFLGAAMWVGFKQMWDTTESTTQTKVEQIGQN